VFDDMQHLNADCLRLIRSLRDGGENHNHPGVVFIGDRRGYEKLRKELAARMYTWHQVDRL
jgi:hypothetical protein